MSVHITQDQHRLTHTELCQFKWILGNLLALVSLWTLAYLDVRAELLLAFAAIGILIGTGWPILPGRLPHFVWSLVVPLFLTVAIVADFFLSQPDIIPPLVRMLLLLVLVRCLQMRRRREDLQLILLCLFMVMLAGVLTLSVTFGFQILVFTPIAMGMLFMITLTEPSDREADTPPIEYHWETFQWGSFLDRIWKAQNFRLLGIISVLFFGVMAVSTLIFITIPRFQINQAIPFLNLDSSRSLSGFSDRIEFGEVVEIIEDNSVALRVDVENQQGTPLNPYWRMVVLDEYEDGVFQISWSAQSQQTSLYVHAFRVPQRQANPVTNLQRWTFYLEGGISKYLPTVGMLSSMRFQNRQRMNLNEPLKLVSTRQISSKVLFYQADSDVLEAQIPATLNDAKLRNQQSIVMRMPRSTDSPPVDYPFTTLVVPGGAHNLSTLDAIIDEITRGRQLSARAFSAVVADYLHRHHKYSLQVSIPDGDHELLIRWLESDQPGHCELFAGAFTLLARRAGYPTRIVTGFKGGAWNAYEQYYMVRNKNAHAWCEVFDGASSWIRVDPTPGSGMAADEAGVAGSTSVLDIDRTLGAYFDSLKILWYRRVVKFDREQQRELAGGLRGAGVRMMETTRSSIRALFSAILVWVSGFWRGGLWMLLLRLVITGGIVVLAIRLLPVVLMRLAELRASSTGKSDPIRRKAGRWVIRFQTAMAAGAGASSDEWGRVYRNLLLLRFGDRPDWPDPHRVFRQARMLMKRKSESGQRNMPLLDGIQDTR